MIKVSFDFDNTLSRKDVQEYAIELINRKVDVWVCTSRTSDPYKLNNDDLFKIADEIGISRSSIIFTGYENKSDHLNDKEFLWHLDDDVIELSFIKTDSDVVPVSIYKNENWKLECESYLRLLSSY